MNEAYISSNHAIFRFLVCWCRSLLLLWLSIFWFVEVTARFEGIGIWCLNCWPGPVGHDHAFWAVWCANTAAIPYEELIAWIEPPSIGIITVRTWLSISMANVVAVWHDASLLSIILFDVLKQIWASGVNEALL